MVRLVSLTLVMLVFLVGCARPPLRVDGVDLSGDLHWQGRVDIYGDVVLTAGSRLTIAPGSEVVFHRPGPDQDRWQDHPNFVGSELIIQGELVAEGTPDLPIVFRAVDPLSVAGAWGGVNISASPESRLSYCQFTQADSALHIQQSTAYIENCRFFDNHVGVRFHSSKVLIENNRFENNDAGIRFHFGAPVICRNQFVNNRKGMFITAHPRDFLIENNSFLSSLDYHIVLGEEVPEDVLARNNWWGKSDVVSVLRQIYDGRREGHLGLVTVEPLRTSPDPKVGIQ